MLVLKFGGTSVANAERLKLVSDILKDKFDREKGICAVVSAFSGVTDMLINITDLAEKNDLAYVSELDNFIAKVLDVASKLLNSNGLRDINSDLDENHVVLRNLLSGVALIQEASQKTRDYILSFGERNCAFILSTYLNSIGLPSEYIDARKLIKTDDTFGAARVNFDTTNKLIQDNLQKEGKIYIATGFIGSDLNSGRTTTLGRGGSDYSAAIFAAALDSKELEIWTDVNGVLTSDPRKVKKAYTIDEMSYAEAMEMSHFGAKVLYAPTIRPVREKNIPTRIKNTFEPENPGTLIHANPKESEGIISGLSAIGNVSIVTLEGSGMQGVSGIAFRFFRALASGKINVIMITQSSSEHSISVAVNSDEAHRAQELISEEFNFELSRKLVDPVIVNGELSLLAIIGENMKDSPGVAGKLFNTLGKNGINIEAIAQGSSELNITFAINKKDEQKALNTIHDSLFLSQYKTVHLFMIGVGLIGSTLLDQIKNNAHRIKNESGIEIVINGLSNSRKMVISEEGIEINSYKNHLETSDQKADIESFISKMIALNYAHSIFVDNTASKIPANFYSQILENNIGISTPNKIALSSSIEDYTKLKALSAKRNVPLNFETNVGAGLPVISTLKNLISSGDKILKIEAVLSGSVSYIFNTFNSNVSFDAIVKEAQEKGFTEPDPREDLSGADVKRKLLILARESGYKTEDKDVLIENILSDDALNAKSVEAFFKVLQSEKAQFETLVKEAESKNERLRFIAKFENGKGQISLQSVDQSNPFYSLSGSDNMIVFHSQRYSATPLVVRGPGAGADVTAAGVLSEIITMSSLL